MLGGGEAGRPGIVHRLDRDTSGLMLVARDDEAHRRLAAMIKRREVDRTYLALIEGRPRSRTGTIDAPLGRDHRAPERRSVRGRGARAARTHFTVLEPLPADTLVEARLETGRTHQIRAHFAAIGHPVAGDPQYGHAGRHGLERQFLHSARARIRAPVHGRAAGVRLAAARRPRGRARACPGEPRTSALYTPARPVIRPPAMTKGPCPADRPGPRRRARETTIKQGSIRCPNQDSRELLQAGLHFGHQTRRWNPRMRRYIHGERDGIHIIDLLQTEHLLAEARDFAAEVAGKGGSGPLRRHEEAGPRLGQGRGPTAAGCRTSTSAGSAAC